MNSESPAQRTELLSYLQTEAVRGVLFVTGDVNFGGLMRIGAVNTTLGGNQFEVLVGPGGRCPPSLSLLSFGVFDMP